MKSKTITQHCIKSHFFNEVMDLPKDVKIISIQFEVGFAIKRLSRPVPTKMVGLGVTAVVQSDPSVEITGRLTGSRTSMKSAIVDICKQYDLKTNSVRVKRMQVASGKNDKNMGVFHRMTKMIPDDEGKAKRNVVLGLVKWDGSETDVANACNTNPFSCKYDIQTVRTVICEEG